MGIIVTKENVNEMVGNWNCILCHGCFDVIHEGHLNYLEEAKKLDLNLPLVVSITEDKYVNKGPGKPIFPAHVRARMIAALGCVSYVVINDAPRATEVIKTISPKFYVKGAEYKEENDLTAGIKEEIDAVNSVGGEVIYIDKPRQSSSAIINTAFNQFTDHQNEWIQKIKDLGGLDKIQEVLGRLEEKVVVVAGEPIIDKYIYVKPEGISSKSPTISSRYIKEESFYGGTWAVQNHLAGFVNTSVLLNGKPKITPTKTRWIDVDSGQRIFEETRIDENCWDDEFKSSVEHYGNSSDLLVLCDFGHGLFESVDKFNVTSTISLNAQTNSSNFGFNPFTKHPIYEYLSLDLREARIAFHEKNLCSRELFGLIGYETVSMTLGPDGSLFRKDREEFHCPAFSDKVVDAIGAGDAYYAITAALNIVEDCPKEFIPFIGNVFAGLKTKIVGNKSAVKKSDLIKTLAGILK